ncbi:isoprenyl transferase [Pontibacillus litoralis]|uniref:Isoprenyl transferase n=1 Tax=Pontibacillus litoralis JSM 072002 TaxID=1385512 RepID=A0A0A5G8N0_9BACI|nr:isoprenyl transferase [Pontibacillus litoralis]KGX88414.1 UDP pyrophosphate synthase [Pontibacillus litoralis JSM 072002]
MFLKLPFTKKGTSHIEQHELDNTNLPKHIAIIMDGNGRWAKKRGLPRVAGHKEGMNVVKKIVRKSSDLGIEAITLYAFSTENWKRPKAEVEFLMKLPNEFLTTYLPELIEKNVQVQTVGDVEHLPTHTQKAVQRAKEKTKHNTGLILNFALNYGSRDEIMHAVTSIVQDVQNGERKMEELNEDVFESYLYTCGLPDPDLLIRTSGEQRLSNYLLWQLAYTEFWFTDVLWPDFDENLYERAICDYQSRKRRYGGV